jgi:hypothetical protein
VSEQETCEKSVKTFVLRPRGVRAFFLLTASYLLASSCKPRTEFFCGTCCASRLFVMRLRFIAAALGLTVRAATPLLLQKSGERLLRVVFLTAEKFVALDGGDNADGAFVAGLGALHAAEAAHADRPSQSDFVREGEKNFDGRAFPDVLGKKKVNTARRDVAGFGASFAYSGAGGPADGEREPHLEALSRAAFGTGQGIPPD